MSALAEYAQMLLYLFKMTNVYVIFFLRLERDNQFPKTFEVSKMFKCVCQFDYYSQTLRKT